MKKSQVLMKNELGFYKRLAEAKQSPVEIYENLINTWNTQIEAEDMIVCASRYIWNNIKTSNLTSREIESMFYAYNALLIVEEHETGTIKFLRFIQEGELNEYGLLDKVRPIDFAGKTYTKEYTVLTKGMTPEDLIGKNVGVIICDFTSLMQDQKHMLSRAQINASTSIRNEANTHLQLSNNILLSIKKALALCETEEQRRVITEQIKQILNPLEPITAITVNSKKGGKSALENTLEMFNFDNNFDTQNYCQTIEFYSKKRLQFNGVACPDTFEKKERMITSEASNADIKTQLILMDGLNNRKDGLKLFQKYCKFEANKGITVELNPILQRQLDNNEPLENAEPNEKPEDKDNV